LSTAFYSGVTLLYSRYSVPAPHIPDRSEYYFSRFLKQFVSIAERVQKGIVHWDKQNNDVLAPNCMLKVQGEIIKVEGL